MVNAGMGVYSLSKKLSSVVSCLVLRVGAVVDGPALVMAVVVIREREKICF